MFPISKMYTLKYNFSGFYFEYCVEFLVGSYFLRLIDYLWQHFKLTNMQDALASGTRLALSSGRHNVSIKYPKFFIDTKNQEGRHNNQDWQIFTLQNAGKVQFHSQRTDRLISLSTACLHLTLPTKTSTTIICDEYI